MEVRLLTGPKAWLMIEGLFWLILSMLINRTHILFKIYSTTSHHDTNIKHQECSHHLLQKKEKKPQSIHHQTQQRNRPLNNRSIEKICILKPAIRQKYSRFYLQVILISFSKILSLPPIPSPWLAVFLLLSRSNGLHPICLPCEPPKRFFEIKLDEQLSHGFQSGNNPLLKGLIINRCTHMSIK